MITRWLNQDTGAASGTPPTTPVLIVGIDYTAVSGGWETVVYTDVHITKTGRVLSEDDLQALADEAERGYDITPAPGFTCPRCGMTSHHPRDLAEGYCGNCHDWTRP